MNYPSPRTPGSTPVHEWEYSRMSSATPTPSPHRPTWLNETPRRPATRAAHSRVNSYSQQSSAFSPRPPKDSPRYNSSGEYATVDVSAKNSSSRRASGSFQRPSRRDRGYSFTYVRSSTPYGESDEDEIFEAMGRTFVLPATSRGRRQRESASDYAGGWYTNAGDYAQGATYYDPSYARDSFFESTQPQAQPHARPPTSFGHHRRSSAAVPQRPQTVRPTAASSTVRAKPPVARQATEADAKRHKIPPGYSLKNWDPTEEPILLLGSVFDANALGKWIYDWTVYHEGAGSPIAEIAGELWLLLIKFSANVKRANDIVGKVRTAANRDLVEDFIEGGDRLMERLRHLLKACEAPMLKAAKKKQSGLGKNAGVEFVDTLFGHDREFPRTEKFMQNVRLFNLRFDANCEDIVKNPTK
ncbi:hypothetical protein B0I35DRAFT_357342 [Stachybotrys elegans]|uniref:Vegetative cell wall protein gp1 n=1 Tax=Stachybotrys elegans TaxID=80388 RepID=A0A8K0WMY9_9HYPO|nr:hypothetical protein B0I35DRAFT_357342 [Stachybotrys elegans]